DNAPPRASASRLVGVTASSMRGPCGRDNRPASRGAGRPAAKEKSAEPEAPAGAPSKVRAREGAVTIPWRLTEAVYSARAVIPLLGRGHTLLGDELDGVRSVHENAGQH